jgi:dTDP-4-dehydrorhamnose reductase
LNTIWITGAGGLIGNSLVQTAPEFMPEAAIVPLTRGQLDLTDFREVRDRFRREKPGMVIHCAALSRSPECQQNPGRARAINVGATVLLAELAADRPMFFFSSDLVFDGQVGNYDEFAPVNPLSVYAETKVEAEAFVLSNPRHTVIRTSLNGGPSPTGDRGFDEQMLRAWQSGHTLRLFTDEFRCPIFAVVTARATWELARQAATGLFHVAGAERVSRWELGRLVAASHPEIRARFEAASLADYAGPPRSPDTSLNCRKAQALLSFPLPRISDWLRSPECAHC